jgi:hypothetical protein
MPIAIALRENGSRSINKTDIFNMHPSDNSQRLLAFIVTGQR